ncbi:MAG: hypothetical protein ABI628_12140 [Chloroflexota bacterium]
MSVVPAFAGIGAVQTSAPALGAEDAAPLAAVVGAVVGAALGAGEAPPEQALPSRAKAATITLSRDTDLIGLLLR